MTMRRSKTKIKEARKALETSSLGRKPRFRLSQLIQSVLMTRTTTDVREKSTALQERKRKMRGEERRDIGRNERERQMKKKQERGRREVKGKGRRID